jgi:hypothetical protein
VSFKPGEVVWHSCRQMWIVLLQPNKLSGFGWHGWAPKTGETGCYYDEQFFVEKRKPTDAEWAQFVAASLLGKLETPHVVARSGWPVLGEMS